MVSFRWRRYRQVSLGPEKELDDTLLKLKQTQAGEVALHFKCREGI